MHFDLGEIIQSIGLLGIFIVVFAESGLLIGMFLPGDSLLFTAGFLASQDLLNLPALLLITFVAALLGDSVGYTTGKRFGHRLFKKKDSIFLSPEHIARSEQFYARHGGKAIVLARFVPIVRTIAPILAGVGKMPYRRFLFFNIFGALLWAVGLTTLGYFLGRAIPDIDAYLLPVIALVVVISLLPSLIHLARDHEQRQRLVAAAKNALRKRRQKN